MGPGESDGQQGAGGRTGGRGSYHLGVMGSRDGPYGVYLLLPAFVEVGWNRIIISDGLGILSQHLLLNMFGQTTGGRGIQTKAILMIPRELVLAEWPGLVVHGRDKLHPANSEDGRGWPMTLSSRVDTSGTDMEFSGMKPHILRVY